MNVNDNSNTLTAEQIIQQLTDWDDAQNIREHMRQLMDNYFLTNESGEDPQEKKIYDSFFVVDQHLKNISGYSA